MAGKLSAILNDHDLYQKSMNDIAFSQAMRDSARRMFHLTGQHYLQLAAEYRLQFREDPPTH